MIYNNCILPTFFSLNSSSYYGGGKKYVFNVRDGLNKELKGLLDLIVNGNISNIEFNSVKFVLEDTRTVFFMCECGNVIESKEDVEFCSCGKNKYLEVYMSQYDESLLNRSMFKIYDDNHDDYLVFNSFIKYSMGFIEIEVLSPMNIRFSDKSIQVSESYIDANSSYGKVTLKKYLVDEAYLTLCTSIDLTNLSSDEYSENNILSNIFYNKTGVFIDDSRIIESFGHNLMILNRCLRHSDLFVKNNKSDIVRVFNNSVALYLNDYYNSLSWDYTIDDYSYDKELDLIKILDINSKLGVYSVENIKEYICDLFGDLDIKSLNISSLYLILNFIDVVISADSLEYIKLYLHKNNVNFDMNTLSSILKLYNKAVLDKKIDLGINFFKYIVRYAENESLTFYVAVNDILCSYEYIDKFKGSFLKSMYREKKIKDVLSEDNFNCFKNISKLNSFNDIYNELITKKPV